MSGQNNAQFPVQGDPTILVQSLNSVWGQEGAGSQELWNIWAPYVYRDSVTMEGGMGFPDRVYDIMVTSGMRFDYKGEHEKRSGESNYGEVLVGPVRAERVDGPQVLFSTIKKGAARVRRLREAAQGDFRKWADFLPFQAITSLVVNGRISTKHPVLSGTSFIYTKGSAFFATDHRVNPMDELNTAVFSNLKTLTKPIDDIGWASTKDMIAQIPDFDGKSLPNAMPGRPMRLMVATNTQWLRWARFLGGDAGVALARQHLQMDPSGTAAVSSVMIGDAEVMLNPYLLTLAEAANQATVRKRTYCFPGGSRKPIIYGETVAPLIRTRGENDALSHEYNLESAYIQAEHFALWGEPRSLIAIDEPAA